MENYVLIKVPKKLSKKGKYFQQMLPEKLGILQKTKKQNQNKTIKHNLDTLPNTVYKS